METFTNPLAAVQLVPIFRYLTLLSDFLFVEQFLSEDDQTKQIPIINGLYEYLENNKNNKERKIKLIRYLLKESDLYGEREDEYFDTTFANSMFDHIISSLVFDKYGGIYSFLANIFLDAVSLQVDEVLNAILTYLEEETFENEYGEKSNLSFVAVGRIYNDIILPLFPVTERNLTLLSLDYIYAQAGLIFLQAGRLNNAYFTDFSSNDQNNIEGNSFDQYLVTGQVIEKLVSTDERNYQMLKAFALPALTYYICNSKYLFAFENMKHVISYTDFWQTAYRNLFQYTKNVFKDIKLKLRSDSSLQMHISLSTFENCDTLAMNTLKKYCPHLNAQERFSEHHLYLFHPENYHCKSDERLPNPKENFRQHIKNITKLFETYYYQTIQMDISNYLSKKIKTANVVVKLLVLNNTVEYENLSYQEELDILEFYYPNSNNSDYYILKLEDNVFVLINDDDDLTLSTKIINKQFEESQNKLKYVVLKMENENLTTLLLNLAKFKISRFEANLAFFDNCHGENKHLKDDWWKEFGLSLIPYSQCSTATCGTKYGRKTLPDNKTEHYTYPSDLSTKIINNDTENYLSSLGTSIKSVFLRNTSHATIYEITRRTRTAMQNAVNASKMFKEIALNHNDPAFRLSFVTKDDVDLLQRVIFNLNQKTSFNFKTTQSRLSKISQLTSLKYRSISAVGENRSRLVFVNTLDDRSQSGYGYKFIFLSSNTQDIAQFRTGLDFKDEKLFELLNSKKKEEKVYMALNNVTFKPEPDHVMYEVDNQLRRRSLKVVFSGIPIQDDDLKKNCNNDAYFERWRRHNRCRRRQRFTEKTVFEEEAIPYIKKRTNLTEEKILELLKTYTFPNNATLILHVEDWIRKKFPSDIFWSNQYKIEIAHVLNQIRFDLSFETHEISNQEGQLRIRSLYTSEEQNRIQDNTTIRSIIRSYNQQKGMYSLSFHDYYAVRNFVTKGYRRITSDTKEAKFMKLALYKLAIRQSEDPIETFDLKLFRVESKPISLVEFTSPKRFITLQKFTETYPSIESAIRFAGYPKMGYVNVIYEMVFNGPYMRAKIEKFYETKETSVILLPGSKFELVNTTTVGIEGLDNVLKLKIVFQHSYNFNFDWYKDIMYEIDKINF